MYLPWSGPGNKTLIKGTRQLGYFGAVTDAELFGRGVFYSISPSLTGTQYNESGGWLKFIINDRVLYIKRYNIMRNITWQMLYDAGAVYGVRGPGKFPSPANGPVDQFKLFTKLEVVSGKEVTWPLKLQLLSGANDYINTTNNWESDQSEWDKLLVNVTNGVFDTLNWTEMMGQVAGYNPIQEFTSDATQIGMRGYPNINGKYSYTMDRQSTSFWWRPVLELITDPNFLLDPINVKLVTGDIPLTTSLPTFKGPDVYAKDIINFAAYNSELAPLALVFSTPTPTVLASVNGGGGYVLAATLSNSDVIVPVSDIVIRNSALQYPQADISKPIGRVQGTNPDNVRSVVALTGNEGIILPIQDLVIQRGALQYPTTRMSNAKAFVSFQNNVTRTLPDVKFTQEQPQTLDVTFSSDTLKGFTL
jgi:hypothetical protein